MIQQLLAISMFPLLIASTQPKLTDLDIKNNREHYEVIGATTGKKIDEVLYTDKRVIETHIRSVLAIKEALAREGIDPEQVKVLLYYDGLTIDDSLAPRMWQNKPHPDTISSPWLDLTRTVSTTGETRITIRIDATAARLMSDLFSKSEDNSNKASFLSIPTIHQSCYSEITDKYDLFLIAKARQKFILPLNPKTQKKHQEYIKSLECAPKELRDPLRKIIKPFYASSIGVTFGVHNQLFLHCQNKAEEYYSQLYSLLVIQGLEQLESKSDFSFEWWTETINSIKSDQKC